MKKYLRILSMGLGGLVAVLLIAVAWNWVKIERLYNVVTLYDADKIAYNFSHMDDAFDTVPFKRKKETFEYGSAPAPLPATFTYKGETKDLQEFMKRRASTALVVVKNDKITYEEYYQDTKATDRRMSFSMGKSYVSAIMGIVVEQGLIDIEKPVDFYAPMLKGSGYEGVRVKDVLQMSSGIGWNEDYGDFNSDLNKVARALAIGGSLDEVAAGLKREKEPGTVFHYVSMDTHVLAMVIRGATERTMPDLIQEYIWEKIGVEDDGLWLVDTTGVALAMGGLNVRTRDYARFGRLFLNNGNWEGEQVVPRSWVDASITPDAPHISPGDDRVGYGYQWWIGHKPREREFLAIGIYGQYIYINQPEGVVIALNSSDRGFMDEIGAMKETIQFFRSITDSLSTTVSVASNE